MAKKGKVKFFNKSKGFGFIAPDEGGDDVFVHVSALQNSNINELFEDDLVFFDKVEGKNGKFQAENIEERS